jgi:hypothetical protein
MIISGSNYETSIASGTGKEVYSPLSKKGRKEGKSSAQNN